MKTILNLVIVGIVLMGINIVSQAQILDSPRDDVYDKIHLTEKKPISYSPVREADIAYEKRVWRMVDLRQ